MKFIKVDKKFLNLFPITVDNLRVELIEDNKGGFYVSEKCFDWEVFYNKIIKNKTQVEKLTLLYQYVKKAKRVEITIKATEKEL